MEIISTSVICECENAPHPAKGIKKKHTMEIKQRCVIKFFTEERMTGVEITYRLRNRYGKDALS
jgi:hypothetical protein